MNGILKRTALLVLGIVLIATTVSCKDVVQATTDPIDDLPLGITLDVSVSNASPAQYSDVSVYIEATDEDGFPIQNAAVTSTWHYKTVIRNESSKTDTLGKTTHTRDISRATIGYFVKIDVALTYEGATYMVQTGFMPKEKV